MIWFKKREPEPSNREQALFELYEKNIKLVLLDMQEDLANVNRQLNELRRYLDAVALKMERLHERNTDAMELKDAFVRVLEMSHYVKRKESEDDDI